MEAAKRLEAEAMMAVGGSGQLPGLSAQPTQQQQQPQQSQPQQPQVQSGVPMAGQGQQRPVMSGMMPPQQPLQQGGQPPGVDQGGGAFDMPMFNTGFTPMSNMFDGDVSYHCCLSPLPPY